MDLFSKKHHYSTNDQIHVAEHELGHALGLGHNANRKQISIKGKAG
ncbi:matrixin family metalloprotease [Apilactobacillus kunkeei]